MEWEEILAPRRRLELCIEGEERSYPTLIEKADQDSFTVAQPLAGGKALNLRLGQRIKVKVIAANEQFNFTCLVLKRESEPLPSYVLSLPQSVERVQLRDHVRLKVTLEFSYRLLSGEGDMDERRYLSFPSRGITIDLSGGGMQATLEEKLESGSLLAIRLGLQVRQKNALVMAMARVVRCQETLVGGKTRYIVALNFELISEKDRDQVVAFIFQKMQSQMRRK